MLRDKIWINVQAIKEGTGTCAIYVKNTPAGRAVSEGDKIWWQGAWAMWAPMDRHGKNIGTREIKLERVGFSGVERPK